MAAAPESMLQELHARVAESVAALELQVKKGKYCKQVVRILRESTNDVYSETLDELRLRFSELRKVIDQKEAEFVEQMRSNLGVNLTQLDIAEKQLILQEESLQEDIKKMELYRKSYPIPSEGSPSSVDLTSLDAVLQECCRLSSSSRSSQQQTVADTRLVPSSFRAFQPDMGPSELPLFAYQSALKNTVRLRVSQVLAFPRAVTQYRGNFAAFGLCWSLGIRVVEETVGLYALLNHWESVKQWATVRADFTLTAWEYKVWRPPSSSGATAQLSPRAGKGVRSSGSGKPLLVCHHFSHTWDHTSGNDFGTPRGVSVTRLLGVEWVDFVLDIHQVSFALTAQSTT